MKDNKVWRVNLTDYLQGEELELFCKKLIMTNRKVEILGQWIVQNGLWASDPEEKLIHFFTKNHLHEVGRRAGTWVTLYMDSYGQFWEETKPESHRQGGGPSHLIRIQSQAVKRLYPRLNLLDLLK